MDWIVNLELNGPVESGEHVRYILDPEGFLAELKLLTPCYTATFSSQEMQRPAEVLKMRLQRARRDRSIVLGHVTDLQRRLP